MIETPAFATSIIKRIIVEGKFILSFNCPVPRNDEHQLCWKILSAYPCCQLNDGSLTVKLNNRSCLFAGGWIDNPTSPDIIRRSPKCFIKLLTSIPLEKGKSWTKYVVAFLKWGNCHKTGFLKFLTVLTNKGGGRDLILYLPPPLPTENGPLSHLWNCL